jgi:hypothetical protein
LVLGDQRGGGRYLRASWHAESRSIVLSHWSDDVCTASSRVALADAPRLIGFFVDSLHHAATAPLPSAAPAPAPGSRSPVLRFVEEARAWLQRRLAPAAPLIALPGPGQGRHGGDGPGGDGSGGDGSGGDGSGGDGSGEGQREGDGAELTRPGALPYAFYSWSRRRSAGQN